LLEELEQILDLEDLLILKAPAPGRIVKTRGDHEKHMSEGAVMLAYAMHLLRTTPAMVVHIHPDGMHAKQFNFKTWLEARGFRRRVTTGTTPYGGSYSSSNGWTIVVHPISGRGDVVANDGGVHVSAECKGGIINTEHNGQKSKLYRGLCETIGLLMASPSSGKQVAVVPDTPTTRSLAARLAPRCRVASIGIALVGPMGEITDIV
jgi:hypothetical protein